MKNCSVSLMQEPWTYVGEFEGLKKVCCSDHRYIQFTVTGIDCLLEFYRNPHRTNWESFRTDLLGCLCDMKGRITNFIDLETATRQFQDAVVFAHNENCPSTVRQNSRNTSWWNQDLAERRRKVCKLFNVTKKSGNRTDYERTLTDYNKALRQVKRESWRRHCEEIEKAPECVRLQRILAKNGQSAVSSLQLEDREYTKTEKEMLEELHRVHLPGSKIILEPSGGGTVLNWSLRNERDPGKTGRFPERS
jgi:hypothetical protein